MDELKTFGTSYFKLMFKKEVPPLEAFEYSNDRIPVGVTLNGQVYYLDIREANRISFIGLSGSGKTWLMRGMIDRLKQIGHVSVYLSDIKGEMISSNYPLQKKFHRLLLEGESPIALQVAELRPTFFKTISKSLPKDNMWYSVDMRRMTEREFMSLMAEQKMTATQQTIITMMYQELSKRFNDNPSLQFSVDLLEEIMDSIEEVDSRSLNPMKLRLQPLRGSEFFISEFEKSIVAGIQRGFVPAINLIDFESFGKGLVNYPVVVLSIVLREVIKARRHKEISQLWLFIDEATRFVGNDKDNAFKHEVLEGVDVERKHGSSFVFCWQSMVDIPQKILYQSRYVFCPSTENTQTIKDLLNNVGIARSPQAAPKMATTVKMRARGRPYAWIVFDRKLQRMDIIEPLAPLSMHAEAER